MYIHSFAYLLMSAKAVTWVQVHSVSPWYINHIYPASLHSVLEPDKRGTWGFISCNYETVLEEKSLCCMVYPLYFNRKRKKTNGKKGNPPVKNQHLNHFKILVHYKKSVFSFHLIVRIHYNEFCLLQDFAPSLLWLLTKWKIK